MDPTKIIQKSTTTEEKANGESLAGLKSILKLIQICIYELKDK